METWRWGHGTWRHRHETWKHGEMKTWTWRQNQTKKGRPGDFSYYVYRLPIVQTEACRLSVCLRRTNGSYPLTNGLNRLNGLAHLCE
jgi:hypothetical protein